MNYNLQHDNVGNFGDIIKHSALVKLAQLISSRNSEDVINYLDTHTFLLEAALPNSSCWIQDTAKLLADHPLYEDYVTIEESAVVNGRYLCSTGLVSRYIPSVRLFLSESNHETRRQLEKQLTQQGLQAQALLSDVYYYDETDFRSMSGPLLSLVDPFYENAQSWRETWLATTSAVEQLHDDTKDGIVIVFQYQKTQPPLWLPGPAGFVGPIATAEQRPYFTAVYATKNIISAAKDILVELGWCLTIVINK